VTELEVILNPPKRCVGRKLVVKLETTAFMQKNGAFVLQKKMTPLKRKSQLGWDEVGVEDLMLDVGLIRNLHKVKDGLYSFEVCNVSYDIESGYADDWEYVLVPYTEGDI